MGYLKIPNLYKDQAILLFKECYATEKIHGTSAHITFHPENKTVTFFSGGTKYDTFVKLFNIEDLTAKFTQMGVATEVTVFGESYGGKEQGMSETYGKIAKFIVFDVKIGECWLDVPKAEKVAKDLGLEFVDYVKVSTDIAALDAERDKPSTQAIRNGITTINPDGTYNNPRKREGVVLRPLIELTLNNGNRVIVKHKGDDFKETNSPRPIVDPSQLKVLEDAEAIANEWVTPMRLEHVLQKIPDHGMEKMGQIMQAMVEDIVQEGAGEFVDSKPVRKAIGSKTVLLYKNFLKLKMLGQ